MAGSSGEPVPGLMPALSWRSGRPLGERCDELAATYSLTGREREILGYLALGHSGAYISEELLISPNTVRTHIHNIYRKVGVASREDIVRLVWG